MLHAGADAIAGCITWLGAREMLYRKFNRIHSIKLRSLFGYGVYVCDGKFIQSALHIRCRLLRINMNGVLIFFVKHIACW